jgi:hypothetical protein
VRFFKTTCLGPNLTTLLTFLPNCFSSSVDFSIIMSQEQKGNQFDLPSRPSCPSPGSPCPFPSHTISNTEPLPSENKSLESASENHIHLFSQSKFKGHHTPASSLASFKELGDPTSPDTENLKAQPQLPSAMESPDGSEAACRSTLHHLARSYGLELSIPTVAVAPEPLPSIPFCHGTLLDLDRRRNFDIAGHKTKSPAH